MSLGSRPRENASLAFTLIQLLVVIFLIAILIGLGAPALKDGFTSRELTRTMNNSRDFYLAGFDMATDGAAKSDGNLAWPGDYPATTTLADYCTKLIQNGYLTAADLQKILSAPGAACTVTTAPGPPVTLTLTGKSALKVYRVKGADPSNTIFAASSNYVYDTALAPAAVPFGDKGFVVVHKSGDASLYTKNQATMAGYGNNAAEFQARVGKLPGAADGAVVPGDGATVLTGPQ